jgi:hypothetical protein
MKPRFSRTPGEGESAFRTLPETPAYGVTVFGPSSYSFGGSAPRRFFTK